MTAIISKTSVYPIPAFTDPDPEAPLSWTCTRNTLLVTMTDCSSGGITSITVSPTLTEPGLHYVDFHLRDGLVTTTVDFRLTIDAVNTPPYFLTTF
jgi:hypothetical protein